MSNLQQSHNSEEEIEVSSLFNQITKFYFYILNNIKNLFKGILYVLIFLLVHFKKNFILIASFTAIFTIISTVLILSKERSYTSSMTVKPNYSSAQLLYKNIEYYNKLIIQKDTLLLAQILECPSSITSKIDEISIAPVKTKNDEITMVNNYYSLLDSSLIASGQLQFNLYDDIEDFNYAYHAISITAKGNFDFKKMESFILNGISKNPHYVREQNKDKTQYDERKIALTNSIKKVDTLVDIFNKVLVENSKKPIIASPNPLFEKERKSDLKDIQWVFDEFTYLNNEISNVNIQLSYIEPPITIISEFNARGVKEPRLIKIIYATITGFLLTIVFLLIRNLISYLNKVENDYL